MIAVKVKKSVMVEMPAGVGVSLIRIANCIARHLEAPDPKNGEKPRLENVMHVELADHDLFSLNTLCDELKKENLS